MTEVGHKRRVPGGTACRPAGLRNGILASHDQKNESSECKFLRVCSKIGAYNLRSTKRSSPLKAFSLAAERGQRVCGPVEPVVNSNAAERT